MYHKSGNMFDSNLAMLAHGANTRGLMGAGVAKTIREKYPENYKQYHQFCVNGLAVPGEWLGVDENDHLVVNLFTQDDPGPNARYAWVASSLFEFAEFHEVHDLFLRFGGTIAIPEIGSGIGGLEWKAVERIVEAVEDVYPLEFEVWHYEG